jgi:hypothetical protein
MKRLFGYFAKHRRPLVIGGALGLVLCALLWYRLGSLTAGISHVELITAKTPLGWHGIYQHPFFFPLIFIRSIIFFFIADYGDFWLRLPNTIFGLLSVVSFAYIIRRWHGVRTAVLATALYATSAWLLHASRLASFDVMYLWSLPLLLCSGVLLQRYFDKASVFYGSMLLWGSMLYTPGLVWLVLLTLYWQKEAIADGWKHFGRFWQRSLYVLAGLIWLPLLVVNLLRPHQLVLWLGAPQHFAAPLTMLKQLGGVFVHLFIRGPQYPDIWLGRVPIMDIFVLVMCVVGIYFYATHRSAFRSRQLLSYFVGGVLLVALHGPVSLSVLVPLLYIVAATGIAYLLHEWLKVFPLNPFARGLGITLVSLAVIISCAYNLRAYYVAWPHNSATKAIFRNEVNEQ